MRTAVRGLERVKERKYMRLRRKAGVILCSILCLIMLLSGCGQAKVPKDLIVPAISVAGDGGVTAYIVENFDKDYYDLEELKTMVEEEIAKFNESHKDAEGEDAVVIASLTEYSSSDIALIQGTGNLSIVEPAKVVLALEFRDIACYMDYTGMELFYGTVAQAQKAGYDLDVELTSVKDGTTITKMDIYELGGSRILIVQDDVRIYGPRKAQYVTSGVAVNEDGSVEPSDTEDNTYIIMK